MNPRIIKLIERGYQDKIKEIDSLNWILGAYINNAVEVAIDHAFNGRKSRSKYLEKPFMQEELSKKEVEKSMTKSQLEKNAENVFLQLGIMGANFNRQKKQESIVS